MRVWVNREVDLIDVHDEKHVHVVTYCQFTWGSHYSFHFKDIPSGCILVSRQLSLISNALSLTFTTMLPLPKKKASTSPEWHLSPEWDILYQHHRVWTGTDIYSAPSEMLRKQSQQKRNNLLLRSLLFSFLTSRVFKIANSMKTKRWDFQNSLMFSIWRWKNW